MASLDLAFGGIQQSARCIQCLECAAIAEKCEECSDYVCPNKHLILKNLNYTYGPCGDPLCNGKEPEIRESNYPNLRNPKWTKKAVAVPIRPLAQEPAPSETAPSEPNIPVRKSWWKRMFCCCYKTESTQ